jgi:SAM-dependent methyltransferase
MPPQNHETDRIRLIYDRKAGCRQGSGGAADLAWACSRAHGDTLEVGIGHGRSLEHYRPGVRLTGLELSPKSLLAATRRARELGIHATLREGDAADLPYPDRHFDTVVFCFALCTIPDDRTAISEAVRVLRPRGLLLVVEHVRSPNPAVRVLERIAEPITVRRSGDHLLRDPLECILAEGLEVIELERRLAGLVERLSARKPDLEVLEQVG